MVAVLKEFGLGSLNFSEVDFLKDDLIFQVGYPPNRIDLLTSVTGLTFKESFEHRVEAELDGLHVNFIDLKSLKENKTKTGRAKDLGDVENLP